MSNYCFNCMNEITESQICPNCHNKQRYPSAPHHLHAGVVLNGRFLVGNCIGEGGFGITYIGRDMVLDIKVAIKEYFPNGYVNRNNTVTQDVTATTEDQKTFFEKGKLRFLDEAKNIARFINEPGIVGIREYFEENGTAYIIMEYLDGTNLSRYVKQNGSMDGSTLFRLMLPLVYSLKKVHEQGIIHRDISPDNIMYLKNGTLKLMDFGSARYFTNEEKEMSVMLKHGYTPEEQYRKNSNQGPWTDVYSLCATIYRCITGITPVDALDRVAEDSLKKPSEMGITITPSLESVLMYGLEVHKDKRCQSMADLHKLIIKALQLHADDNFIPPSFSAYNGNISPASDGVVAGVNPDHNVAANNFNTPPQQFYAPDNNQFGAQQNYMPPQILAAKAPDKNSDKSKKIVIFSIIAVIIITALIVAGIFIGKMLTEDDKKSRRNSDEDDNLSLSFKLDDENETDSEDKTEAATEKVKQVTVPDCEDMKSADAVKMLEDLGLKVKTSTRFSNTVEKDHVISQSIAKDTKTDEGSHISLVVSKGSEECPNDYEQKLVVTAPKGSSKGTATFYEWEDGEYKKRTSYTCTVGSEGIGSAREGASITPSGIHDLGVVLSMYNIQTNMDTYKATSITGVVYDTSSVYYNQIMEKSHVPNISKFDQIGQGLTNGTTYATIYIEHNGSGFSSAGVTKGKGSAIGLRGQFGSLSATYGDVDISSTDMEDLISRLDYYKNPVIEIKVK